MDARYLSRRTFLKGFAASTLAAPALSFSSRTVSAADPIQMILYRYPASEFYAEAMKKVPGADINIQLMPSDKVMELVNINLSSGSANFDIIPCNDTNLISYVAKDWLMPLDDLWAKYKDEYDLGGINDNFVKGSSSNGHIYQLPNEFNSHLLFYRKDLYEELGLKVPATIQEFRRNAEKLKTDKRAGTTMMLRVGDQCASEMNYYLNVLGDGWFDERWQPLINSEKGIKAVEFMYEMGKLAQRGFTSAAGDEGSLALYQGFAGQGNMWATRAASMEDPKKSRFVGKFGYAVPAQGGQRLSVSGLAISKFTKKDPDMLFRVMLETVRPDVMKGNIANNVPTRTSVLEDESLAATYPYLKAAAGASSAGRFFPAMPYFYPAAEIITRRLLQVMTDEMGPKNAMDTAAVETKQLLTANGFYKG
jgi:ABC-type glycerol-3-phosphate transport system substrate-binding protein